MLVRVRVLLVVLLVFCSGCVYWPLVVSLYFLHVCRVAFIHLNAPSRSLFASKNARRMLSACILLAMSRLAIVQQSPLHLKVNKTQFLQNKVRGL